MRFAEYMPHAGSQIPGHGAYVHSTLTDNFPIVLLEALAAGASVFGHPAGGAPEVFTDGGEGRYWDVQAPEAAAGRLIEILENQKLHVEMANGARSSCIAISARESLCKELDFEVGL